MPDPTPTDTKRQSLYMAKAIVRFDEPATDCLEREYPGERKRIEGYRAAYHNPDHPEHAQVVAEVSEYYRIAGDWLE